MHTNELHRGPDGEVDRVIADDVESVVRRERGYVENGTTACITRDTGNGFIARFPAHGSVEQDYYVCLNYSQARDLVLALSGFKEELGFGR